MLLLSFAMNAQNLESFFDKSDAFFAANVNNGKVNYLQSIWQQNRSIKVTP